MDSNLKAILNGIRYVADNSDGDVYLDYNRPCFVSSRDNMRVFDHSRFSSGLSAYIDQLVADGYIVRKGNRTVFLTYKGLHPHRAAFDEAKRFLQFSVVTPIVVSIITAILTVLVLEWLGLSSPR